jgi:hypothetical protein
VAGDPSTSRSGARTFRRITGHMAATQPSWVRGSPTTFGETASFMELRSTISPLRPLRQTGDPSQAALGARSRRSRGSRAQSAIRCTAPDEEANGSSTPDSGPENPVRGSQAKPATQRSGGAAHRAPPTAATDCQRHGPVRRVGRAGPTLPAGEFDPEPGPRRPLPPVSKISTPCDPLTHPRQTEWGNDTLHGPALR